MAWNKKIAQEWRDDRKEGKRAYDKQWRKDNYEKIRQYERMRLEQKRKLIADYKLTHGCAICGYNKCSKALDFHHENNDKDFAIASNLTIGVEKLLAEMEKCTVLCSNCHRELHDELLRE